MAQRSSHPEWVRRGPGLRLRMQGGLRFQIGDEVREAGPHTAILAPKGTPHAYGNATPGLRARYLLVMTPKIRALVHALHEPGAGDYAAIFRAHDSELLS